MMFGIRIEQPPDHSLVLRVVPPRLVLEELDTTLTQSNSDLDPFFAKDEVLRRRQEIRNDPEISDGFVGVLDFRAHKFVCLSANSLRQIFESLRLDR